MNSGVVKFQVCDEKITNIELESGENVVAEQIISTCGVIETESLLSSNLVEGNQAKVCLLYTSDAADE